MRNNAHIILFTDTPTPFADRAFFATDLNLTLSGTFNILGRSVAIFDAEDNTMLIACAPIIESESLYASQFDDFLLTMWQQSPYENSTLTITSDYPSGNPDVSILQDAFMVNGVCSNPSMPYNPFGVTVGALGGL